MSARQWQLTRRMAPGTAGGRSRIATPTPTAFIPRPGNSGDLAADMILSSTWAQNDSGAEIDWDYPGDTPATVWSMVAMEDAYAYEVGFPGADNVQFWRVASRFAYGSGPHTTTEFDPGDISDEFSVNYLAAMESDPVDQRQFIVGLLSIPGGGTAPAVSHPNIGTFTKFAEVPSTNSTAVSLFLYSCDVGDMSAGSGPLTISSSAGGNAIAWIVWRIDNTSGDGWKGENNSDGSPGTTATPTTTSWSGDYLGFVGSSAAPTPHPMFASPYDAYDVHVYA